MYLILLGIFAICMFILHAYIKRSRVYKNPTPSNPNVKPKKKIREGHYGSYTPSEPTYFPDKKEDVFYSNEAYKGNIERYNRIYKEVMSEIEKENDFEDHSEVFGSMLIPDLRKTKTNDEGLNDAIDDAMGGDLDIE